MRFMVMVKANKDSEGGAPPKWELMEAMGRFNEEMVKAGVMLAAEGLQPSSKGARVRFDRGKRSVIEVRRWRPYCSGRDWSTRLCLSSIRSCWAGANASFRTAPTRANSLSSARRPHPRACSSTLIDTLDHCEPNLPPPRAAKRAPKSLKAPTEEGQR